MKSDYQKFLRISIGFFVVFLAATALTQPAEASNLIAARLQPRDGGGGSGANTTVLSEDRYVDKYWQYNPLSNEAQYHIFIGGEKLATLNASGTLQFNLPDHLGSAAVISDENGSLVEAVDYKPYGQTAIQTGAQASNYLFTGKEKDEESGLQYFGARYLDNTLGNFTSVDPLLAQPDDVALLTPDPQQMNSYRYARNNPLVLIDPSGKKVELVTRPVNPLGARIGAHTFVLITNNEEEASRLINVPGVYDKRRITLGGYPSLGSPFQEFSDLVKQANQRYDLTLPDDQYISRTTIDKPERYMTQSDFENAILGEFNALPDSLGAYSFLGQPRAEHQANSNNVTSAALMRAGVPSKSIIDAARPNLRSQSRIAPGLGTTPPKVQSRSIVSKIFALEDNFTNALSGAGSYFTKMFNFSR